VNTNGNRRVGVWVIGARGSIGAAAAASHWLIERGGTPMTGLVTESLPFRGVDLLQWNGLLFGGCDVVDTPLIDKIRAHIDEGILPRSFPVDAKVLRAIDSRITNLAGAGGGSATPAMTALAAVRQAIRSFREDNGLERVIVVNCSSTLAQSAEERSISKSPSWPRMLARLPRLRSIPWGIVYAAAALEEQCAFINFTPNSGTDLPALADLARRQGMPHAGRDGKTGETLVKSVLAPLFSARAMHVLAWQGYNMLGNGDGHALSDPGARALKIKSKDQQLRAILGQNGDLHTQVSIDYVPSLGDWKTAWDFIHFEGFLGVRMAMQFTWQGCDTVLATPLILDLVRLVELAWRRGESGELRHLCSFFKSPIGCEEHDFRKQLDHLYNHLGAPHSSTM
jgi:myo-inositol-1-phosphate synthase